MGDKRVRTACVACGVTPDKYDMPRGLCHSCYDWHYHRGSLDQFPRGTWPADELVAEAELLRKHGATRAEVAKRLGVSWNAVLAARGRLKRKAARDANRMVYIEHLKLEKIAPLSQAIGEFLEWLPSQGTQLMRWAETVESDVCDGTFMSYCRGPKCEVCGGTKIVETKHSAWVPNGKSVQDMLAEFFEIDQDKLEAEKRHMLETLRSRQRTKEDSERDQGR